MNKKEALVRVEYLEGLYTDVATTVLGMVTLTLGSIGFAIAELVLALPLALAFVLEIVIRHTVNYLHSSGAVENGMSSDNIVREIIDLHGDWLIERFARMFDKSYGYLHDVSKTKDEIKEYLNSP